MKSQFRREAHARQDKAGKPEYRSEMIEGIHRELGSRQSLRPPKWAEAKINPVPEVWQSGDGHFFVRDLLAWPFANTPSYLHPLRAECEYCHREIQITLRAPLNIPKFVEDEAKRVAIL
jgi:hypothetical protein